ncbi:hypothetical protein AGDE_05514 [Angomonas deanei]|nr:hypothetical protein AGDE_05514 [Angomonas deanei]|eukprot:EPY38415.1 hypothetical protein AGDE_05514 [Angomonas deanei]
MHAQEKQRRENQQLTQGRQSLKKKHLDLLREFHERQFFYWYERASERLQYMSHINYIPQSNINEHIEKELDKYVVGSKEPYPLNFVGQIPMLEDKDGNVAEVPETLMTNYVSENPATTVKEYKPREGTDMAEEQLLRIIASSQEEELSMAAEESAALRETLDDMDTEESLLEKEAMVSLSMEQTDEDRAVNRRAYIDRGKTGSRTIRRPRFDPVTGEQQSTPAESTPIKRRKSAGDHAHELQKQMDGVATKVYATGTKGGAEKAPGIGEIAGHRGRLRDIANVPSLDTLKKVSPQAAAASGIGSEARIRTQDLLDKKYGRGKYKKKGGNDDEDL